MSKVSDNQIIEDREVENMDPLELMNLITLLCFDISKALSDFDSHLEILLEKMHDPNLSGPSFETEEIIALSEHAAEEQANSPTKKVSTDELPL